MTSSNRLCLSWISSARGSVVKRFMPCGKPSCRCIRQAAPLWLMANVLPSRWSYKDTFAVRSRPSMRLTSEQAKLCQEWLENHRRLKNIIRKITGKAFPQRNESALTLNDPEVIRAGDRLRRCSRDGPESAPRKASCEGAASARAKRRVATTGSSRYQHTARRHSGLESFSLVLRDSTRRSAARICGTHDAHRRTSSGARGSCCLGLKGLKDRPRPGHKPKFGPVVRLQLIVLGLRASMESENGVSRRTIEQLRQVSISQGIVEGISWSSVQRILAQAELRPHLVRGWMHSPDPEFREKVTEITELYLNPPPLAKSCSVSTKKQACRP